MQNNMGVSEYLQATPQGEDFQTSQAFLDQLRRWQDEPTGHSPRRNGLAFPGLHSSIVEDEAVLEQFLAGLLRVHLDPSIERLLGEITKRKKFVIEARRRRSFRLAALWLACVFDRTKGLPLLDRVFRSHEEARRLINKDRKALAGTIWESWFETWTKQLYPDSFAKQGDLYHQLRELQGERDQAITDRGEIIQETGVLKNTIEYLNTQINERTMERNAFRDSLEHRIGEFLIKRFHCRPWLRGLESMTVTIQWHLAIWGLTFARWASEWRGEGSRVLAAVCAAFPIYSQTFVHQELSQLAKRGFQLRLIYSSLESRKNLHHQFNTLWKNKSRLSLYDKIYEQDFERYRSRYPEKVERLLHMVGDASGLPREQLIRHPNFLQAFSFTRMAEVYRPHYLHSYFFYDRSLMALVAGYLLDIPRGISCYADHALDDYELKVVPLHLELCDTVIATSERIKAELLAMAPKADPNRILVKPNAIDTKWFPHIERCEPKTGEPFRLVCVNRIEPKKGLLYLVEAIHHLRQRGHDVELHVIGTADEGIQSSQDYQHKLDECISHYNLWGVVHLEGQHNQEGVLRFLDMSQVFIAPFVETDYGDKDGIPTALLEAMATGLPIVATDAGSMGEVIQHDREGDVVPQRDSQALADSIARLLTDPQRRKDLGQAAAETVRQRFDVSMCEHRFHDRVLSVIESRHPKEMSRPSPGFDFLPRWISRMS